MAGRDEDEDIARLDSSRNESAHHQHYIRSTVSRIVRVQLFKRDERGSKGRCFVTLKVEKLVRHW